jgi:hypothetical protein
VACLTPSQSWRSTAGRWGTGPGGGDVDDGERSRVPLPVGHQRAAVGVAFVLVLASDVDEERVAAAGDGLGPPLVVAPHQHAAQRGEEPAGGVDLLQVVLGLDEGVVAAPPTIETADTKKCVKNALDEPVCNRFWVPVVRFNAPRGGE